MIENWLHSYAIDIVDLPLFFEFFILGKIIYLHQLLE